MSFQVKTIFFFTSLLSLINVAMQSIAGITYMDDFDFESRYTNIYECDPFYWHPLHLPAHCLSMFEKLIRRGIGNFGPVKVVRERGQQYIVREEDIDENMYSANYKDLAPYQKMIWRLGKDVAVMPTSPNITVYPGLGVVALYKQPVSKKNGDYIKKVAKEYNSISFGFKPLYDYPGRTEELAVETKDDNQEVDGETLKNGEAVRHPRQKYHVKRKFKKNGLLTIVRSKHD